MLAWMSFPIPTTARLKSAAPDLAQGLDVGGVGLHDVGQVDRAGLDDLRRGVDAEHVVAQAHERLGERAAEAAEADDEGGIVTGHPRSMAGGPPPGTTASDRPTAGVAAW